MEFSPQRLKQLHEVLLEILNYVVEVCNNNNLKYLLVGGTALGAYRHAGFIPWDDDLDIALPREDYNKLLNILRSKENELYLLQDEYNEERYFLPFAKIRKNGTIFLEAISKDLYKNNGIYIDIFPIDDIEDFKGLRFKYSLLKIRLIGYVLRFRSCKKLYKNKENIVKYLLSKLLCLPFINISNRKLLERQRKYILKCKGKENKYMINFASTYSWKKEVFNAEDYFPGKKIKFEGNEYYSCANIEKYLTQVYGNYMELPPEEKRHTHEPLELRF